MSILANLRLVMLLLAIFMVGGGFTFNVDVFEETHEVVARNAAGLDRFSGMAANAFVHAARAAPEVTGVTLMVSYGKPTSTSKASSTVIRVTRVTAKIESTSTSEITSNPIGVTRVTLTIPTGTSEVSTTETETETETEPCGGDETTWSFIIVPTSTVPASTPATKTETETETETVICSHSTPCHTTQTSSIGFGITISLTSTVTGTVTGTKVSTSSGVAVTSGRTLVTKSSGTGTKTTVESTPLKSGTSTAGTATATTAFNGARKLEGFNKLTATGLFLLVCKLVL